MSGRIPNLFLVGAMKCATTYLTELLRTHPSVFFCEPTEPTFFVDPAVLRRTWRHMWARGYWRSPEAYLALFAGAQHATVIGEASTNYSKLPLFKGVPERIHAFNPQARYVYVMRDPVERTISHYWHNVIFHRESRPMLRAIERDAHYRDVSHYAMQLEAYFGVVPREQVYVLTYEQLTSEPGREVARLFTWLGLDPRTAAAQEVVPPINVTPEVIDKARGGGRLRALGDSVAWRALVRFLPRQVRAFGHALSSETVRRGDIPLEPVIDFLRPIQLEQTRRLARLLGREFPEWTTLYGTAPVVAHSEHTESAGRRHASMA